MNSKHHFMFGFEYFGSRLVIVCKEWDVWSGKKDKSVTRKLVTDRRLFYKLEA